MRGGLIAVGASLAILAAVALVSHQRGEEAKVERAMRAYITETGIEVRSCDETTVERDGLDLWECVVHYPETVLTPEMDRTWNVAVDREGKVVDASPKG